MNTLSKYYKITDEVLAGEERYSGRQGPAFERIVKTNGGRFCIASREEIDEIKEDHIKSDQ